MGSVNICSSVIELGGLRTIENVNYKVIIDAFMANRDGSYKIIPLNELPIEMKNELAKMLKQ